MAFVLTNLTEQELNELHDAVYNERRRRVIEKIDTYPVPATTGRSGEDFSAYRKLSGCSLHEAFVILEYYRNKAKE